MFVKSTLNVNPLENLSTGEFQEFLCCSISVHDSDNNPLPLVMVLWN